MFSAAIVRTLLAGAVVMAGVSSAAAHGSVTQPKQGQGGSVIQGSAGTNGAKAPEGLQTCEKPMGAMAVVEPQTEVLTYLRRYQLSSPVGLIRMMIQQSNCFIVVERGAAGMNAMNRERALMQTGEMRQGSNFGAGQMVASDYGMSPEIVFSNQNAGGMGGALGGLVGGRYSGVLSAVGGSMQTKEASAMLTLVDNRSGVQVSASEGSASKTDFGAFGSVFGGSAAAGLGGYTNTAQGKVISAAFMDAFNQMVVSLRNYKAQTVQGQGLGGGGRLGVDGGAAPSQTSAPATGRTKK